MSNLTYGNSPTKLRRAPDFFSGDGVNPNFTLSYPVGGPEAILVIADGAALTSRDYSVAGTALALNTAPSVGVENIEVRYINTYSIVAANWNLPPIADNTGTADAITCAYNPAVAALTDNLLVYVVLTSPNLTTTPNFSPNGLPAKTIVGPDGSAIKPSELKGTVLLRFEATSQQWFLSGSVGSGNNTSRGTLTGTNITAGNIDLAAYGAFDWSLTGNSNVAFPTVVPNSGTWYIDVTVNATGGYDITWASGYNKAYGYYFDCLPNARYRFWLVARSSSAIDVSVERIV